MTGYSERGDPYEERISQLYHLITISVATAAIGDLFCSLNNISKISRVAKRVAERVYEAVIRTDTE